MRKPILYMTAAATGLALLQTPLPTQAAPCQPNVSVIRVCPGSATTVDVNDLLGQLGITGCNQVPDCTPSDCNPSDCNPACDNTPGCTTPDCIAPDCITPDWTAPDCAGSNSAPSTSNCPVQIDWQSYLENWNCYFREGNANCKTNDSTVPATQHQEAQPQTEPTQVEPTKPQAEQPAQPEQAKPQADQTAQPEQAKPQADQTAQPEQAKPQTDQTAQSEQAKPQTDQTAQSGQAKPQQPAENKPSSENTVAQQSESDYHAYVLRIVSLVNEERAKAGLQPVQLSKNVTVVAQLRAQETVSLFSHTRPNGTSCFTALAEAGISYRGAGENIAYGQRSPEEVMNGWMNSSGHRANILNANFTTIGVGYYQAANGVKYWSQMFTY